MAEKGEFSLTNKREIPTGLINTIVAMYQIALSKALGSGSAALTQLILREATEIADEMLKAAGVELGEVEDIERDVKKVFEIMGIAEKVEVEIPSEAEARGSKYIIRVYDSIFKPVQVLLAKKGIKFTLSPEAFIAAYVVRKALRKKRGTAQLVVKVKPVESPDQPLEIELTVR